MGRWRALRDAMRVRRIPRIGPGDADRLLAGDPPGPELRGLAALLDAARAAPSPGELAGERAAVARFVAAYREAAPTSMPKGRNRARRPSPASAAAMKVAAFSAVLAVGGTAVAAETGHLPATAQRHAHDLFADLGVPAPQPVGGSTTPVNTPGAGHASTAVPSSSPASSPAVPSASADPRARGLCRAWAAQRQPHGKAMSAKSRRQLVELAGDESRIADFCAPHQDTGTPEPSATPSNQGNGNGNQGNNGNEDNNGNGNEDNNGNGNEDNNGNGNEDNNGNGGKVHGNGGAAGQPQPSAQPLG